MKRKYYRITMNAYERRIGTLYAPEEADIDLVRDAKPVLGWQNLIFTLRNGLYAPYHMADIGANLVNEELKSVIEEFITPNYPIEFLPVKAISDEYGEKHYYIMHFKIIFDVLDLDNSVYHYYEDGTKSIVKKCLDLKKVNDLNIFNSLPAINDIIVSDRLRKVIIKRNLNFGIVFSELKCV